MSTTTTNGQTLTLPFSKICLVGHSSALYFPTEDIDHPGKNPIIAIS